MGPLVSIVCLAVLTQAQEPRALQAPLTPALSQGEREIVEEESEFSGELSQTREQLDALANRFEEEQARLASTEASRLFRLGALNDALETLRHADLVLDRGHFEAQEWLAAAAAGLEASLSEARVFGTEPEQRWSGLALTEVSRSLEALSRRDFMEARRFAQGAMWDVLAAHRAAQEIPPRVY
ncbi:MAG: hypothetical protein ACOZIN_19910 [Myxococcota bacterium]